MRNYRNWILLFTLFSAAAGYVLIFSAISILSQETFSTSAYDVGLYDQGIWLMSRFQTPFTTIKGVNLFGDHASFYSLFIVPLFWIWDNINILYLFQTLFLALGAVPLFLYARNRLKSGFLALSASLSFLLYPALQNMNMENFHPETAAVFFLMLTFYFLLTENFQFFYPFAFLSAIGKEDIGITVAFMGLYLLFFRKQFKHGIITLGLGIGWYLLATRIIMPLANGIDIFSPQPLVYSYWFCRLGQNILNPFFYMECFFSPLSVKYLADLMGPVLYIPLLSPSLLFVLLPSFTINLLSKCEYLVSIYYHYNYVTICFVYFGLIEGLNIILKLKFLTIMSNPGRKIIVFIVGFVLLFSAFINNSKLSNFPFLRHWETVKINLTALGSEKNKARREALKHIPKSASVSASYPLVPHLTHRKEIFMFPNPFRAYLWGMWFKEGTELPSSKSIEFIAIDKDCHSREDSILINHLISSPNYEISFKNNQVLLLKRVIVAEKKASLKSMANL